MTTAERRSPYGDQLLGVLRRARRPLSFDDLARAATGSGAHLSDVVAWLVDARAGGVVEDVGYADGPGGRPVGPRRFQLSHRGQRISQTNRRRGDI